MLVTELSRWGRSTLDLLGTLRDLQTKRVSVIAMNGIAFDLGSPYSRLMATIIAGIAEFERELVQERIRSDMATEGRRQTLRSAARPRPSDRLVPKVLALVDQGAKSYTFL